VPDIKIDNWNQSRSNQRREMVTDHKIGTREEWLAARLELLAAVSRSSPKTREIALIGGCDDHEYIN
jgi:hypothetical protein